MNWTKKSVVVSIKDTPGDPQACGWEPGRIHANGTREESWRLVGELSFGNAECEVPVGHPNGNMWTWSSRKV